MNIQLVLILKQSYFNEFFWDHSFIIDQGIVSNLMLLSKIYQAHIDYIDLKGI
jgi:hypothetical protein